MFGLFLLVNYWAPPPQTIPSALDLRWAMDRLPNTAFLSSAMRSRTAHCWHKRSPTAEPGLAKTP